MSSPSSSYNSSLLVIVTLLVFAFVFTIIINLILHLLARLSGPSSPSPYLSHLDSTSSSSSSAASHLVDPNRISLIESLPIFTTYSLALSPSATCTICLSNFTSVDKIRLLPACRHTFHSPCIDAWLKTSPSCPLCRSVVQIMPVLQREKVVPVEESVRVSWLKEYVDRLASASSSFNSMRFSGSSPFGSRRWGSSQRFDEELGESFRSEESGYFASSYKWMMNTGATS